MSAKHRCKKCGHRPGKRVTNRIYKGVYGPNGGGYRGKQEANHNPSKKPCDCECHQVESSS